MADLIIITDSWLRERVKNAIKAWKEMDPSGPRKARKVAAGKRSALMRQNGMSDSGDLSLSGILPAQLVEILAMDETESERIWGYKCGMGYHNYSTQDHRINDIIFQELPDLKVSSLWGAPAGRGQS